MSQVQNCIVNEDEGGMRLDRWFKDHYPGLSFGQLQKLARTGQVRVNGGRIKLSSRLETGQSVRVPPMATDDQSSNAPRRATPRLNEDDATFLRSIILHEDKHLFVFNKPAGLAVQGGSGIARHVDGMLDSLIDKKGQKPRLVHRLDRDTSGVLVVAKTRKSAMLLAESFRLRETKKIYWAVVRGVPRMRQGRISNYLMKYQSPEGDKMRVVKKGGSDTQHALSYYSVVERMATKLCWISLRPITGRTHQLRIHSQFMGHPIIGDPKYFDVQNWELPGGIQNKLHLHARQISIPHPAGGKLNITAPMPTHMQQTFNLLGFSLDSYDPDIHEFEG
ncbi:MAG: RNA pseudouridine synthase [Hyphomicrobiales bacterium]|nr:MAG: RNA pseudouridine synthase [Hyphomicrobiales bacterium]